MNRLSWIENAKAVYHPQWLRRWKQNPFSVMPIYLEVSPVGMCNHRCTFCAPEMLGYPNRSLSLEVMQRFLHELRQIREEDPDGIGVKAIQYAGEGEPTLHKHLADIFRFTREADIDVGMLTNGTGLTEHLAKRIIPLVNGYIQVSVNAGTKETYIKIHRAPKEHWDLMWKNVERAIAIRNRMDAEACEIGINMVVLTKESRERNGAVIPPNWSEIELLVARAREIGADYVSVKPYSQHIFSSETAQHYGDMSYANIIDDIVHTGETLRARYNSERFEVVFRFSRFKEYEEDNRGYTVCRATPTIWSYIQSDGLWLSCSAFWTDARFALGNVNNESVREIWFGERRRKHMEFVSRHLDVSECRKTCHPDKENRLFAKLVQLTDSEFETAIDDFQTIAHSKRANFI